MRGYSDKKVHVQDRVKSKRIDKLPNRVIMNNSCSTEVILGSLEQKVFSAGKMPRESRFLVHIGNSSAFFCHDNNCLYGS
jgi:hypothetical protein